jgi:SAM-dependent methyltransferase
MSDNPIGFDWRFLPGIPSSGKVLILHSNRCQPAEGLSTVFDVVITMSERLPMKTRCSQVEPTYLQASGAYPPLKPHSFDLIAFPNGLYVGGRITQELLEALLKAIRRLLRPGGVLYLGFMNSWSFKRITRGFQSDQFRATLSSMRRLLHRTGFQGHGTYAMIPDHKTPVYITPLHKEVLGFSLGLYLRRSRYGKFLGRFFSPRLVRWISWSLPGYGIVAKATA